jgi:hypothetical protein
MTPLSGRPLSDPSETRARPSLRERALIVRLNEARLALLAAISDRIEGPRAIATVANGASGRGRLRHQGVVRLAADGSVRAPLGRTELSRVLPLVKRGCVRVGAKSASSSGPRSGLRLSTSRDCEGLTNARHPVPHPSGSSGTPARSPAFVECRARQIGAENRAFRAERV